MNSFEEFRRAALSNLEILETKILEKKELVAYAVCENPAKIEKILIKSDFLEMNDEYTVNPSISFMLNGQEHVSAFTHCGLSVKVYFRNLLFESEEMAKAYLDFLNQNPEPEAKISQEVSINDFIQILQNIISNKDLK